MDIMENNGMVGRQDERIKKLFGFGIKAIMDLGGASCAMYFIVEAAKRMKYPPNLDHDHHDHGPNNEIINKHQTVERDWGAAFGLMLCFILFFLLAIDLISSCRMLLTDVVRCQKVEPLDNNTNPTGLPR